MITEVEEELSILQGTKSPHGYLTSQLSDNIHMTDEGYLVVVGCPIARTGWQKYSIADLPQELAKKLGVDVSNQQASIDLYRPEKEVFDPEFLSSLNGKPITDGHPPDGQFVDPKNFQKFAMGHIQNVRKGTEPMEDGEWPIIADLMITAAPLIDKIRNKVARELSLGYDFSIDRDGEKIIQCDMLGNHNAVVPKGRAGEFIRIEDAMPATVDAEVDQPQVSQDTAPVDVIEAVTYNPIALPPIPLKEKHSVAETKKKKDWLRLFKGTHLITMARATDADPEEVMDAAEALAVDEVETPKNTGANEFKSEDKKAKDGEIPEALRENAEKKKEEAAEDKKGKDSKMSDARKAAHDALDAELDAEEAKKQSEDAEEPDASELDEILSGEDAKMDDCPDCGKAHDAEEECASGEEVMDEGPDETDPDDDEDHGENEEAQSSDKRKAGDRARAADSAMAVLKMLRPGVAKANDKKLNALFNSALGSVQRHSRASSGSYGGFAASARARDRAPRNPNPDRARAGDSGKGDPIANLQQMYNESHNKGGK